MNNTLPISAQKLINHNEDMTAHNNRFIAIENDYEAQIQTEKQRAESVETELEARSLNRYNDMLENYATKAYVSSFCGNNVPMTKEEYCSDLTKGVLLTNSNCAWNAATDIELNQPYTSFRFLRVDYTGKSATNINTNIIDVKLFHQLMTSTFSDAGLDIPTSIISNQVGKHFNLTGADLMQQWLIFTSNGAVDNAGVGNYKSTTTLFKYSGSNTALILGIWGFE